MKGDIRCITGTLWRHDPQRDDPDLEVALGPCPDCRGKGCEELPCPRCTGAGGYYALVYRPTGCTNEQLICSTCQGAGYVSSEVQGWIDEGEAHRSARVGREESLRECARRLGVSAAIISAMETGRARPRFSEFCLEDDTPPLPSEEE